MGIATSGDKLNSVIVPSSSELEKSSKTRAINAPRKYQRRTISEETPYRMLVTPSPTNVPFDFQDIPKDKKPTSPPSPSSMVLSNTPMSKVLPITDTMQDGKANKRDSSSNEKKAQQLVFTWKYGGQSVLLAGTFNNWSEKLPMQESHGDFTCIQSLQPGLYYYRYIVDGKWQTDPAVPMVADANGEYSNVIEVGLQEEDSFLNSKVVSSPPGSYGTSEEFDPELTKSGSPPSLPPHLKHALLNTSIPSADPQLLPLPHHVMLNHIYSLPRREDKVLILGVTHRYTKRNSNFHKFVTTVYYKPLSGKGDSKEVSEAMETSPFTSDNTP